MAIYSKEVLGVERLDVLADKGYYNGDEIVKCLAGGIMPYVPDEDNSKREAKLTVDFRHDKFS